MTLEQPIVHVIDDDAAVRASIKDLLDSVGMRSAVYACGRDFLDNQHGHRPPGCLILDVRLPGSSGLEFQQELLNSAIEIPIVFITGHGDIPMSVQAMKAGAVDFLSKPFREQELLDAINKAVSRDRTRQAQHAEIGELRRRYEDLTPREREVMDLVNRGLLNKQIATQLGASETTVKIHRAQVMRKMQAETLPDLVRMAERLSSSTQ